MSRVVCVLRQRAARVAALLASVLLTSQAALALQSVTLVWDPSPDPTVVGYNIYYGTNTGVYTSKLSVGNVTNAVIDGLIEGRTYYFAATAFNAAGLESDPSNEVSYTVPYPPPGNVAPTLNLIPDVAINEDSGNQTVTLSGISSGATNENQTLTVTAVSSNPGLIPNPAVSYASPNPTGSLSFAPVANGFGTATITVTVNDGQLTNNTVSRSLIVTVNAVNDAPGIATISNVTINEDAGLQTISLNGINSGAANESQTLTVSAASSNPALIPTPVVTYASPSSSGTLTFTPVANAFGTATVTVTVSDGQAQNSTAVRTFTVTVLPVNDLPTLDALSNIVLNENAGAQTVNLTGITPGPSNETESVTITATSSNPSVVPNPIVNYSNPARTGTLTFTPASNAYGVATITVTVNDGQSQNNTAVRTFTVSVNWVNQRPTLAALNDLSVAGNAGLQTVNLSGISSGATNEAQALTVRASSGNPGLIPNPTVNYTSPNSSGTLTFTPAQNASGSALITVTVDDGQAANNTITRTFTVSLNSTNQAPTINPVSDLVVSEDAGLQTVSLTGISSGAGNEVQTLTLTASSSNPSLVPAPAVAYTSPAATGSLTFSPAANAFGTATITVTVNDGQSQNNLTARTFTVTVNPVNDPPTLDPLANVMVTMNSAPQVVNLSGITAGPTNETEAVTVTAVSSSPGVVPNPVVNYSSPARTGTLSFAPAANASGSAVITVTADDGQAQNRTAVRTFTVTINQPPLISSVISNLVTAVNTPTAPLPFTIGDAETLANNLTLWSGSSNPALMSTNNIRFGGSGTDRTVTLTPATGQTGYVQVAIFVSDGLAVASNSIQVTVLGKPAAPGNFHVVVSGSGTLFPNLDGKNLIPGKTYTVTAVASAGQEFAGWSGTISSAQPTLTFVMTSNLVLNAKFLPSPFISAQGFYNGLFRETTQVNQESSGYFAVSVNYRGKYSGYLRTGARRYAFSGSFSLDGLATNTIVRPGASSLTLRLALGTATTLDTLTGMLTEGTWTAALAGYRAVFHSRNNPAALAGVYTLVLPGFDANSLLPAGNGFASLRITPAGVSLISGRLADGTGFSQGAYISKDGLWPMYAALYYGSGSVFSWLTFTNWDDDIVGKMSWIKPALAGSRYYPAGFTSLIDAAGSLYTRPLSATARVLPLETGSLSFEGGNLTQAFVNSVALSNVGKVSNFSPNRLVGAFNPALGLFSGAVIDPSTGTLYRFMGAAHQKRNAAYGSLFGADQSSDVTLAP